MDQNEQTNSAPTAEDRKALPNLKARAALAGCAVSELDSGELILTRWGMAKACPDLRSVVALLDRLGGAA